PARSGQLGTSRTDTPCIYDVDSATTNAGASRLEPRCLRGVTHRRRRTLVTNDAHTEHELLEPHPRVVAVQAFLQVRGQLLGNAFAHEPRMDGPDIAAVCCARASCHRTRVR